MDDQKIYRLMCGTIGQMNGPVAVPGMKITVQLRDENGNIIFKTGIVAEILE